MATNAPPTERVTKQFRIDPDTWDSFAGEVEQKAASGTLRRLIALWLTDPVVRRKAARMSDPAPDRRYEK